MQPLYNDILNKKEKIAIIGLGYVGLPQAIAFSKKVKFIGYDINRDKIRRYNSKYKNTNIEFTWDETSLQEAKFIIIAVPTPINNDKTPDLNQVKNASRSIGRNMKRGTVVVYESTVYPGATGNICIPILEQESGLKVGKDFKVGYSPERINPGDKNKYLGEYSKDCFRNR